MQESTLETPEESRLIFLLTAQPLGPDCGTNYEE